MEGKPVEFENFVVYPEYCELDLVELLDTSFCIEDKYFIAALQLQDRNLAMVIHRNEVVYSRPKYRLHYSERGGITRGIRKPEIVELGSRKVLILICYEIIFPEDYLNLLEKPDLVIHMVGSPMFDEEQREGWLALQQVLTIHYNCPLVCCCGGPPGRMNLSGVIYPTGVGIETPKL